MLASPKEILIPPTIYTFGMVWPGIEPTSTEADVLPVNYQARVSESSCPNLYASKNSYPYVGHAYMDSYPHDD